MLGVMLPWLLSGCGGGTEAAARERPEVVATVGMVGDMVKAIAGDRMTVRTLIGEGVDPHSYQPTRRDVLTLGAADAIVWNGLNLEGKMGEVIERMGRRGTRVLAVAESLQGLGDYLLAEEAGKDPHIWMDVGLWARTIPAVVAFLTELDPEGAEDFARNGARYGEQLAELDAYVRRIVATLPEDRRVLITAHDAFGYFGRAYGVEVHGIQGISTESEAGLRDIEELVRMIVARRIPAIFVETSVADKNVRALIEGARARGHEVRIGGELFSDAMGAAGSYRGTYIGMLDHNATTIVRALGGNAPVGGFQGLLE